MYSDGNSAIAIWKNNLFLGVKPPLFCFSLIFPKSSFKPASIKNKKVINTINADVVKL